MIKKTIFYFGLVIVALTLAGCQPIDVPTPMTPSTIPSPTPQPTMTFTVTPTPSPMPTATPNIPAEAQLQSQCLEVEPSLLGATTSDGIAVLDSEALDSEGHLRSESYFLDMSTGKFSHFNGNYNYVVSPDRTLVAYRALSEENGRMVTHGLMIADTSRQSLKVLPWKDEWLSLQGWADNQRLILMLDEKHGLSKPFPLLVLNPFTGEQQILRPNFSKFLDVPGLVLPYWEAGWYGVLYDPTLTRAIYPCFIGNDQEMFTYGLWDVPNRKLITSLEETFSTYSIFNDTFPMPRWSPDGSKFVLRGLVRVPDEGDDSYHVKRELYQVSHDGQVKQLTHLYPFTGILDSMSWSPDGRYLAGFLVKQDNPTKQALAMVLDTQKLNVINYCIPVTYAGEGYGGLPPSPVWSPDSKQFLIVDWYEKDHRRVIMVDIAKGIAAEIAQDMEPMGWMTNEP